MKHVQSPETVGFLIFPGFPMSCLTSMIEPLRAANEISGEQHFDWRIISETGTRVESSARVGFDPDLALADCHNIGRIYLLGGPLSRFDDPRTGDGHLRRLARHGVRIGAVSGAVFPLARSGLLDGCAASVHWCYSAAFTDEFPDFDQRDEVIVVDRERETISGAAAAFDFMLNLIAARVGEDVATEVACWFQHPTIRAEGNRQSIPAHRLNLTAEMLPEPVTRAISILSRHIEERISIEEVAEQVAVSSRQLERLFKTSTGLSPSHYYRGMRMRAARQLVLYTKTGLGSIALAVGYKSLATMQRHYTEAFGLRPKEDRLRIMKSRLAGEAPLPMS